MAISAKRKREREDQRRGEAEFGSCDSKGIVTLIPTRPNPDRLAYKTGPSTWIDVGDPNSLKLLSILNILLMNYLAIMKSNSFNHYAIV